MLEQEGNPTECTKSAEKADTQLKNTEYIILNIRLNF